MEINCDGAESEMFKPRPEQKRVFGASKPTPKPKVKPKSKPKTKIPRKIQIQTSRPKQPLPTPKPAKPAEWKCCAGSGAQTLGISSTDYYGPLLLEKPQFDRYGVAVTKQTLDEMKKQFGMDIDEKQCPEDAGPHAGTHCGLRLWRFLRQKQLLA